MRSGLLCVLVITCIRAQLYTTNDDVRQPDGNTRIHPKPPGKSMKNVRKQMQTREEEEGNTYSINTSF